MAKQEQKKHAKSHTGFFSSLSNFKKDLLCIGLLYVITVILFSKVVFNNEVFSDSGDTAAAQAISQGGKLLVEKEHIEQRKLGLQKKISKYTDLSKKIGPQEIKEMVMEEIADKAAPAPQQQTLFSPSDITQKQPKQKAPPKSDLEKEIEGGTMKIPTTLFPKKPTAKLSINPDVFANYNEKLKEDVVAVLSNLSDLIDNINKFYIQNTPGSANAAKTNAANIQQNI